MSGAGALRGASEDPSSGDLVATGSMSVRPGEAHRTGITASGDREVLGVDIGDIEYETF